MSADMVMHSDEPPRLVEGVEAGTANGRWWSYYFVSFACLSRHSRHALLARARKRESVARR